MKAKVIKEGDRMLLNIITSMCFYTIMLAFGHLMCFVEVMGYHTIPIYFLILIVTMGLYRENCKALEIKDFIICAIFVALCMLYFYYNDYHCSIDVICYMYLAVFLPYTSFASWIRYRSLM